MDVVLKTELQRWGLHFICKNEYGSFQKMTINSLGRKGELRVHEMLGLQCQWVEGDIVDENGLPMPDVEYLIVDEMEGNEVVKAEDLPVIIVPKVSYTHRVDTPYGPETYPLIYAYDVIKIPAAGSASMPSSSQESADSATCSKIPAAAAAATSSQQSAHQHHDLVRQLSNLNVQPKLFKEEFRLTGCNMRQDCQHSLSLCRSHMLNKRPVLVRVEPEPTNPVDRNAIAFQVQLPEDVTWHTVGYVGVAKIPKVKAALDNGEIVEIEIEVPHYGHSATTPGYFSAVQIMKTNKWLPNDPTNEYLKP